MADAKTEKGLDITALLQLIEIVDILRVDIIGLGRIKRGVLNSNAKILLRERVRSSLQQWPQGDAITNNVRDQLSALSIALRDCASNDDGGYIQVERLTNEILYWLGFIKGYLFLKYEQCITKRTDLVKKDDFDKDDMEKLSKSMKVLNTKRKPNVLTAKECHFTHFLLTFFGLLLRLVA